MELNEFEKLSFEDQNKIYRDFGISKLGKYPDKIEKVGRVISLQQKSKESEEIYKEYQIYIENYNDSVFTGKIK